MLLYTRVANLIRSFLIKYLFDQILIKHLIKSFSRFKVLSWENSYLGKSFNQMNQFTFANHQGKVESTNWLCSSTESGDTVLKYELTIEWFELLLLVIQSNTLKTSSNSETPSSAFNLQMYRKFVVALPFQFKKMRDKVTYIKLEENFLYHTFVTPPNNQKYNERHNKFVPSPFRSFNSM